MMALSYLLSGGIGRTWPLPGMLFDVAELLERPLHRLGMFSRIVVERRFRG
jgi:hypothetical protein